MNDTLEFWYDFASTYSYPAAMRVERVAAEAGLRVVWQPFLLGPIFTHLLGVGDSPFNTNPVRGRYMWRDLQRLCAADGLALSPSQRDAAQQRPRRAGGAGRRRRGLGRSFQPRHVHRQLRRGPRHRRPRRGDRRPRRAGPTGTRDPRAGRGRDAPAGAPPQTETAVAHGIFGAPSFIRGGELFFGGDRLAQALAWTGTI
jgi:2-hydroxychromene-2-carboxylate isomerase